MTTLREAAQALLDELGPYRSGVEWSTVISRRRVDALRAALALPPEEAPRAEGEALVLSESAAVARQIAADSEAQSWRQRCELAERELLRANTEAKGGALRSAVITGTLPLLRDVADDIEKLGCSGLARDMRDHRAALHRIATPTKVVTLPVPSSPLPKTTGKVGWAAWEYWRETPGATLTVMARPGLLASTRVRVTPEPEETP